MRVYIYTFTLHVKYRQNKITLSPDTNKLESAWEYEITKIDKEINEINKIIIICKKEN